MASRHCTDLSNRNLPIGNQVAGFKLLSACPIIAPDEFVSFMVAR
jgi:hypothetical protein